MSYPLIYRLSQFKTHSAVYDSDNKWNDLFNGLTFHSS